jgi:hypothetical protein
MQEKYSCHTPENRQIYEWYAATRAQKNNKAILVNGKCVPFFIESQTFGVKSIHIKKLESSLQH